MTALFISSPLDRETHLQRRARVDAGNVGMGVRRAQDSRMKLIGELEVVEKSAAPPQQASSRRNTDCPMANAPMIFPKPAVVETLSAVA